jgi:hypothetical protein
MKFAIALIASVVMLLSQEIFAFTIGPTIVVRRSFFTGDLPSSILLAKKRRRKRKNASSDSSPASPDTQEDYLDDDDLPDFDMGASNESEQDAAAPKMTTAVDPDTITDAMMGTQKPLGSVKDLLSDRSLESKFVFDEPDEPLPDFAELARSAEPDEVPVVGSKKARQAARRAAAIARKEEEEKDSSKVSDFLSNLPLVGSDRENESLKLVETGTWIGIFLLIAWEVYINSPFFERTAPMAPIVYELYL